MLSEEKMHAYKSLKIIIIFVKDPGAPCGLNAKDVGPTQVTLEWKEPELVTKEGLSYSVSQTKAMKITFC